VALSRGLDFGVEGAGFARLNFATSREILDEIVDRLVRCVQSP
jgi:cystathionine beta-lyase